MSNASNTITHPSVFRIKHHRNTFSEYLIDQDKADFHLKNFLELLKDIIQLSSSRRDGDITEKQIEIPRVIEEEIKLLNERHRSFAKVKSLALSQIAFGHLINRCYENSLQCIELALINDFKLNGPHFVARNLLLKMLILSKKKQYNQKSKQLEYSQLKLTLSQQIAQCLKYFKKLNWNINNKQIRLQQKFWETQQINELLIYQYQNIIKNLSFLGQKKICMLYKRGIQIAEKYLGQGHKLTNLLIQIYEMKVSNRQLFRLTKFSSRSVQAPKNRKMSQKRMERSHRITRNPIQQKKGIIHDFSYDPGKKIKTSTQFYKHKIASKGMSPLSKAPTKRDKGIHQCFESPKDFLKNNLIEKIGTNSKKNENAETQINLDKQSNCIEENRNKQGAHMKKYTHGKIIHQEQLIKRYKALQNSVQKINLLSQIQPEDIIIDSKNGKQTHQQIEQKNQMKGVHKNQQLVASGLDKRQIAQNKQDGQAKDQDKDCQLI